MSAKGGPRVVVVGGGTAGITVAARFLRRLRRAEITIIEPSAKHYYQPLWTLVGAGVFPKAVTERDERSVIPKGVTWVQDSAVEFAPRDNTVITNGGRRLEYDYLVVAVGIRIDWDKIKGLPKALGRNGVCSNYDYRYVDSTWEFIRGFGGGEAIFTMPNTPVKCGGAPQKIMYLADDYFRRAGVRDKSNMVFVSAGKTIFSIAKYRETLEQIVARKAIETVFRHNLVEIRPRSKEAVFENLETGEHVVRRYDLLHVTPPMGPPDVVKNSPLATDEGWVAADKYTLQHPRYANVFSLGDASSLPTSKTGAAVRKQALVLVDNLLAAIDGRPLTARYNGYTSCPIVTGYGKLVLAEFDYDGNPLETFPFDQSRERLSMYLLKKYVLPAMYWHGMLKGRA